MSHTHTRREHVIYYKFTNSWPAYWDTLYHRRPQRRRAKKLCRQVIQGRDPDDMSWPDGRKPHAYYW